MSGPSMSTGVKAVAKVAQRCFAVRNVEVEVGKIEWRTRIPGPGDRSGSLARGGLGVARLVTYPVGGLESLEPFGQRSLTS